MISKDAIQRGYNRRNYIVGAHTPPAYAKTIAATDGPAGLQRAPIGRASCRERVCSVV